MTTATIYKITCTKAYMMAEQGTRYSLQPWGCNTPHYNGTDDGGSEYVLPSGYHAAETTCGETMIFDPTGRACEIIMHPSGRPQLVSGGLEMPVLAEV